MANVTQSLFGFTPQDIQAQRAAELDRRTAAFAQLTPMQQAQASFFRAGSMFGDAAAGALGYEDPEMAQARARQGLLGGLDIGDPNALRTAAANADPQTANLLISRAMELEKGVADVDAAKALADQRRRADRINFGADREAVAKAMYKGKSFNDLTPLEATAVNRRVAEMDIASKKAGATTIALPPQGKKEQEARGALLVKQYETVSDTARNAARTKPTIETNLNILNKGFETGFGTETIAAASRVLGALGVPDAASFATNSQVFTAAASGAILQKQLEQKGPQTEADAQRIEKTSAQLANTPAANKFILNVALAQANKDIEQRKFYDKWWQQNKTYDGAEDAWFEGEGGKSLFNRPELKQYRQSSGASSNEIPGEAAPSTPMYAKNPKTGQRIVSYDGGKNWQPTR